MKVLKGAGSGSDRFTVDDATEIYGIQNWGRGYLAVDRRGHLIVTPSGDPARAIDVRGVIDDLLQRRCPHAGDAAVSAAARGPGPFVESSVR